MSLVKGKSGCWHWVLKPPTKLHQAAKNVFFRTKWCEPTPRPNAALISSCHQLLHVNALFSSPQMAPRSQRLQQDAVNEHHCASWRRRDAACLDRRKPIFTQKVLDQHAFNWLGLCVSVWVCNERVFSCVSLCVCEHNRPWYTTSRPFLNGSVLRTAINAACKIFPTPRQTLPPSLPTSLHLTQPFSLSLTSFVGEFI